MDDAEVALDRLLHSVGEDGVFHRRYNLIFNLMASIVTSMVYFNLMLVMATPRHWCHVPNRDVANVTDSNWKTLMLPKETDSFGRETFSSCKMYDEVGNIVGCKYGYEYDESWYANTVVSSGNWVCENSIRVPNVLALAKGFEAVGGVLFGYIGDVLGRRPAFLISLLCMSSGRLTSVFVANWYWVFAICSAFATLPSVTLPQSSLVTIMEISSPEDRPNVLLIQNLGWSIGTLLLPFIYWSTRRWTLFILITTAPIFIYVFLCVFLIESPRWLLARGRVAECLQQLRTIARINKTKISADATFKLQNSNLNIEKTHGIISLFSNWRLAKNTTLMTAVWTSSMMTYYMVYLTILNMAGNPYLNFFLQGLVEIPAYLFGQYFCNRFGRRFCGIAFFCISFACFIIITLTIKDGAKAELHLVAISIAKFSICMAYFATNIQSVEMFPTSVRQSANSFAIFIGSSVCITGSYFVYLGTKNDVRIPYTILLIFIAIGIVSEIFLPETLHERLPDTIYETKTFGEHQGYWNMPYRKRYRTIKFIRQTHNTENE